MKVLKALAVAYLVWALFYSLTSGRAWVADALAFKLNGGPELVHQLEKAGYSIDGVQIDKENRFLSLSLSRKELHYGRSVDVTYLWGSDSAPRATAKPKSVDPSYPKQFRFTKTRSNWALVVSVVKEPGLNPASERNFVNNVQINPNKSAWRLISETRFNLALVSAKITADLWRLPEITNPLVVILRTATVYPVLLPFVFAIGFSPPQIASVTAYLPILIYGLLIFLLTRGLFKR